MKRRRINLSSMGEMKMDFQSNHLNCLGAKKLFARVLGVSIVASFTLLCRHSWADTIYLKSGSKIKGVVVSESANEVNIRMDQGMIAMDRAEIRRITKDPSSVFESQEGAKTEAEQEEGGETAVASKSRPEAVDKIIKSLVRVKSWIELKLGTTLTVPIYALFAITILLLFLLLAVWQKNNRLLTENQELREKLLSPGKGLNK